MRFPVLSTILLCGLGTASGQPREEPESPYITLRTDHFATALTLKGDPGRRKITSIELHLAKPGDEPTGGSILLDESILSFDDFGDAHVDMRQPGMPTSVTVLPLGIENAGKSRRLYQLRSHEQGFTPVMHLAYSINPYYQSRLLIKTKRVDEKGRDYELVRILPLKDSEQTEENSEPLGP